MNLPDWQGLFAPAASMTILSMQLFFVIFVTVFLNFLVRHALNHAAHQVGKTVNLWDDAFVDALRTPLRLLIWLGGISVAVEFMEAYSHLEALKLVGPARQVFFVVIIAWFLNGFISRVQKNVIDPSRLEKPMDDTTASAIAKLLRVSVHVTAALIILQSLGYSVSGVLAFGGIGGMAVGFAAKDLLANFFGGLTIYLDRPFSVGDWIRSPDRSIEGTVEDIGWRLTRIRTFDKRPLYVPNATFTTIALENPSRMTHRRIYETIGLRYDDASQLPGIIQAVKDMLIEHPEIDHKQTLIVNFNAFGPSSLDFFIYTFTVTTDWIHYHEVKQDVLFRILKIVDAHGAEVAFPTTTVHLPEFAGTDSANGNPALPPIPKQS